MAHRTLTLLLALTVFSTFLMKERPARAGETSAYTKLNLAEQCIRIDAVTQNDEAAEGGGTFRCAGFRDYPIYFKLGDLRESLQFGHLDETFIESAWESFAQWNQANDTFEWRLRNGIPFAVIHRVFIDTDESLSGDGDPKRRGQVLVVSAVASAANGGRGCVIGLVDARQNKDANERARAIADAFDGAPDCSAGIAHFHGKTGATTPDFQPVYP